MNIVAAVALTAENRNTGKLPGRITAADLAAVSYDG